MDPVIGGKVLRFDAVESTNDAAKERLGEEAVEGTIVVADRQVAGRGRHGRPWFSPLGGLYCSIVLKPPPERAPLLTLLSGIPIVKTLRHWSVQAALKWPNDVLVGERKIAGILCEGVYRRQEYWVVVGIGVNTNVPAKRFPVELRRTATSVVAEAKTEVEHEDFLAYLAREYEKVYRGFQAQARVALLKEYVGLCSTIRRNVEIASADGKKVRGTAIDVTPLGALVLVDEEGAKVEVADGTVRYR